MAGSTRTSSDGSPHRPAGQTAVPDDGRLRHALTELGRAAREFGVVPLAVILAFAALAALCIVGDQSHAAPLDGLRNALGHVIGGQASSTTLQAIATGLVTVTSITFSVLLLAVQQTASSLSPVVFDQFLRRRGNQVLLGFFIGLALFAYLVLAATQDDTPPIIGAFVATVLTVVAMVFLLALIYTTVDQMRPSNVIRQIHDRVLAARGRERALLGATRRSEESPHDVQAVYRSTTTGYLTAIDLDRIADAVAELPSAEIVLHLALGEHVHYDQVLATVRDDDPDRARRISDVVRSALTIGRQRDMDHDASTGLDQLANIAWTSGSTAKQNPEIAREALFALQDLAARWTAGDADREFGRNRTDRPALPVVYPDRLEDRLYEVLYSLGVAAHESQQHMQAARLLDLYRMLLRRTGGERQQHIREQLALLEPLVREIPDSPRLRSARAELSHDRHEASHRSVIAAGQSEPRART